MLLIFSSLVREKSWRETSWSRTNREQGINFLKLPNHIITVTLAFLILVQSAGAASIDHLVSSRDSSRNG